MVKSLAASFRGKKGLNSSTTDGYYFVTTANRTRYFFRNKRLLTANNPNISINNNKIRQLIKFYYLLS